MGNIEKFDLTASRYDTAERIKIAKVIANTIRAYIIHGEDKIAIDYGCGTGLVGMELLDAFRSVLFVDASRNMIEQVKQKLEVSRAQNADTLCCDLTAEYPQGLHADYIIVVQTLLHIWNIEPLLARLYTVLNKGGHLVIVDFDKNDAVVSDEVHNGFEQEKLIGTIGKLGFINAAAETFYHGDKMLMNKDASLFILDAAK